MRSNGGGACVLLDTVSSLCGAAGRIRVSADSFGHKTYFTGVLDALSHEIGRSVCLLLTDDTRSLV